MDECVLLGDRKWGGSRAWSMKTPRDCNQAAQALVCSRSLRHLSQSHRLGLVLLLLTKCIMALSASNMEIEAVALVDGQ